MVAVDTSYVTVGKDQACATCIYITQLQETPHGPAPVVIEVYGLKFWNPTGKPERFGWRRAIQLIQSLESYSDEQSYLLVVDPDIHEIPEFNLRRLPLIDDYYLPKNFEMLYASSDTDKTFFVNYIFSIADKESKELRKLVAQQKPHHMDTETASTERCTFFEVVKPVIYVEEIDSLSKPGEGWQTYVMMRESHNTTAPQTQNRVLYKPR